MGQVRVQLATEVLSEATVVAYKVSVCREM
jgi:hypothetical protein